MGTLDHFLRFLGTMGIFQLPHSHAHGPFPAGPSSVHHLRKLQRWIGLSAKGVYLGLFVLTLLLVVSCDPQTLDPSPNLDEANRITLGTTRKPRTLDPADSYEISAMNLIYNMGDRLYTYADPLSTELVPQLATALPTISNDGLTYQIPLRQDVMFHDGTPFNAEAMAFSLRRFMENGGKPSFLLSEAIAAVEASDAYELTITLQQPFAAFTALLAFPGACAVSPQAYTIGPGEFKPTEFVGTGPYRLASFGEDAIRLDIYEDYWGERPSNPGVNVQVYNSNPANLYNSFRTGAIDVAYLTLDVEQVQTLLGEVDQGQWRAIETPGISVNLLALNLNQPPLDQREVRQAIATLIDRNFLIERALPNLAEPLYSLLPTTFDAYRPTFADAYPEGDFGQAQTLLRQAGYSRDNPAVVELWYPTGSPARQSMAITLQATAEAELDGLLQFSLHTVEPTTGFANIPKGIYPTFMFGWYPDFLDPDNYVQPFLGCTQGSQVTGCQAGGAQTQGSFYWNPTVNQLISQERQETDPQKRQDLFEQIQTILAEDVPYIPLWQDKDYAFTQTNIDGVAITLGQNFPFWTLEKQP
jgi:peptide/nickel transport system substrate-binding protein